MGGIVFAKLSRPKKRKETLIFSKKAVISTRDGVLCLMCRIGDMRRTHITNSYMRAYLIRRRVTVEGEVIPYNVEELSLLNDLTPSDYNTDRLMFMPVIVEHVIDEKSPLFNLISKTTDQLNGSVLFTSHSFEILFTLNGNLGSTGAATQVFKSYLPTDILWNHIFQPMMSYSEAKQKIEIDFALFNSTKRINQSRLSIDNQSKIRLINNNTIKNKEVSSQFSKYKDFLSHLSLSRANSMISIIPHQNSMTINEVNDSSKSKRIPLFKNKKKLKKLFRYKVNSCDITEKSTQYFDTSLHH
jgi:hypothetical protein